MRDSALQCLGYIAQLRSYLTSDDYLDDVNADNAMGYGGKLASALAVFLKSTWFASAPVIASLAKGSAIGAMHADFAGG